MNKTLDSILIGIEKLIVPVSIFTAGISATKAYESIQNKEVANSFYLSGMSILFLAAAYWDNKYRKHKNAS